MTVEWTSILTKDLLNNYEDASKYAEFEPKLKAYREKLANSIPSQFKIDVPGTVAERRENQFNPLQYLYDEKLLSESELAITESSAVELASRIASGNLTSVAVFKAFSHRAAIAHQLTNCYLDIFIDEGLKRAEYLDDYYKEHGKVIGPLHGIPVSVKEHMSFKNKITHASYVGLIENLTTEHGLTTQILEELGAVFYVRSVQPQTLMHFCSNNNYIGPCSNPYNSSLTAGGSSSGEGASVGFGASALGVGSDIGGSIRGPAAFSGAVGLKPTSKRVSLLGGISAGKGQESVPAVIGPLARTVEDIDYWMEHYLNIGKPWERDATLAQIPWKKVDTPDVAKLKIAIIYDDGFVRPTPPITRSLKHVAETLKSAGAEVVTWEPLKATLAFETVKNMYSCDGNDSQRRLLSQSGEPLLKLTKYALNIGDARQYTVSENRLLVEVRDTLRQEYLEFMNENKIDFIISPTYSNVAAKLEAAYSWSYTALWNILDYPTLVFQTGLKVEEGDDWSEPFEYRSDFEALELQHYDAKLFKNAPIGLQITGRRYNDEEVVAAGKAVVEALGVNTFKK